MGIVFMHLIVMYDLPTKSKKDKLEYTSFRASILKDGFSMIQYSVYIRTCKGVYSANAHIKHIKKIAPNRGQIRIIKIPHKAFMDMEVFGNVKKSNEEKIGTQTVIEF